MNTQSIISKMNQLETRIKEIDPLNEIEDQMVAEINRNSIRLDQII